MCIRTATVTVLLQYVFPLHSTAAQSTCRRRACGQLHDLATRPRMRLECVAHELRVARNRVVRCKLHVCVLVCVRSLERTVDSDQLRPPAGHARRTAQCCRSCRGACASCPWFATSERFFPSLTAQQCDCPRCMYVCDAARVRRGHAGVSVHSNGKDGRSPGTGMSGREAELL